MRVAAPARHTQTAEPGARSALAARITKASAERRQGSTKMDERRNAARFRELPAFIAHPEEVDLGRTHAAPTARLSTSRTPVALGIGLVIVAALSVALAVGLGRGQRIAEGTGSIVPSHLGAGYPAHHGLAGPSRLGPSAESWLGYPPHFGLAGPSRVGTTAAPIGIGAGYPPHYGLAGPSHVDDGG
jgi:hypothetical protein